MARKKKHAEHVNHERWLVSYADFITLLFAFFVVMFAVSQVDSKKVGRFTESFSKAVGVDIFPQPGRGIMPGVSDVVPGADADSSKTSPLPADLEGLQQTLSAKSGEGDEPPSGIQVIARRNELVLRLSDGLLFDSGNDALREPAVKVLQRIVAELKKRTVDVRVEGHTDNRPIRTARFRSNWDLSTSRATAVVALLAGEGLPAARLSAAGYGEFHPIGENATEEGRRKNRRVDLIVSVTPKESSSK
jgi:chemotaxis protein MotB